MDNFSIRFLEDSVLFPFITYSGHLIGFQERMLNSEPKYMIRGSYTYLWPHWVITQTKHADKVYLTEGVFGALRLRQHGMFAFAVMGTKFNTIDTVVNQLTQMIDVGNIVAVFDNDSPGKKAALAYMQRGCSAFLPGIEADEINKKQADLIKKNHTTMLKLRLSGIDIETELMFGV
jgi:DNA primase